MSAFSCQGKENTSGNDTQPLSWRPAILSYFEQSTVAQFHTWQRNLPGKKGVVPHTHRNSVLPVRSPTGNCCWIGGSWSFTWRKTFLRKSVQAFLFSLSERTSLEIGVKKIRYSRTSQGQAVCFGTGNLNKKKKEAVHLFNVVGLVSSVYFGKMCFYSRIDADIRLCLSMLSVRAARF